MNTELNIAARRIFNRLDADISDRRGLGNEWEQISPNVKNVDIRRTWEQIITEEIEKHTSELQTRVKRLEASLLDYIGASEQDKTECIFGIGKPAKHQYYLKNNSCTAISAKDSHCICWRDEGTGPLSHRRHSDDATLHANLEWRVKRQSKEFKP